MTDDKDIQISVFFLSCHSRVLLAAIQVKLGVGLLIKSGPVNDLNGLSDWEPVEETFPKSH